MTQAEVVQCTCCGSDELRPSWMGTIFFKGREFGYLECRRCRSLRCEPMPNAAMLSLMYGEDFKHQLKPMHNVEHPKDPAAVLAILRTLPSGTFMDYGCGAGDLLAEAKKIGWSAAGGGYDRKVAGGVAAQMGWAVYTPPGGRLLPPGRGLHFGGGLE